MYASYSSLGSEEVKNVDQTGILQVENIQHKMDLVRNNRIVCVEVYADWCGPCKTIASEYATMASEFRKYGILLVKYNYDRLNSEEKSLYQVIPVFEFYVNGQKIQDNVIGGDINRVRAILDGLITPQSNQFTSPLAKHAIRNFKPS